MTSRGEAADRHRQKRLALGERLQSSTGKSAERWAQTVEAAGIEGFTRTIDRLKAEHGLSHFQARLVAEVRRDGEI